MKAAAAKNFLMRAVLLLLAALSVVLIATGGSSLAYCLSDGHSNDGSKVAKFVYKVERTERTDGVIDYANDDLNALYELRIQNAYIGPDGTASQVCEVDTRYDIELVFEKPLHEGFVVDLRDGNTILKTFEFTPDRKRAIARNCGTFPKEIPTTHIRSLVFTDTMQHASELEVIRFRIDVTVIQND